MSRREIAIEKLKAKNIKPSIQRLTILQYLYESNSHPTVDNIYIEMKKSIPTLSRATVYNTVNILVEAGLVRKLNDIEKLESRYDAILENHGHFICNKCLKIYDFNVCGQLVAEKELHGFCIDSKEIYFRGICPNCNN